MLRVLAITVIAIATAFGTGCDRHDVTDGGPTVTAQQPIGNGVIDSFGDYNAVVRVNADGNCSGTLLTPYYVVTAQHCLGAQHEGPFDCTSDCTSNLDVNQAVTIDVLITAQGKIPSSPTLTISGSATEPIAVRDTCPLNLCEAEGSAKDVALIRLATPVPLATTAPINPPIVRLPSLTFSPSCMTGEDETSFDGDLVGYGPEDYNVFTGESGNDERARLEARSSGWERVSSGVFRKSFPFTDLYEGSLSGDSGGGLFVPRTKALCAVTSSMYPVANPVPGLGSNGADLETSENQAFLQEHILDASKTHFVGQCNPGEQPVHPFIRLTRDPAFLDLDNDRDTMPDWCDPCPFTPAPDSLHGDYAVGDDFDGDGVPNECDNCPGTENPWPSDRFADQADNDGDHHGDLCDLCSEDNLSWEGDFDSDAVGDACDNCQKARNNYRTCVTDADCLGASLGGQAVNAKCLAGEWGRCDTVQGGACRTNADCPTVDDVQTECLDVGQFGACSKQLDDVNADGLGAACDRCDSSPNVFIHSNSNDLAEYREHRTGKQILDDPCDSVPEYISRPVIQAGLNDKWNGLTHTLFTSSSSEGTGTTGPILANVGFRWCDCFDANTDAFENDRKLCFNNLCTEDPLTGYGGSPDKTTWRHVTTSTVPALTSVGSVFYQILPAAPGAGADAELLRAFTPVVNRTFKDSFLHPDPKSLSLPGVTGELRRIGPVEYLYWHHVQDVFAGRVTFHGTDAQGHGITQGLFWSHVPVANDRVVSDRDNGGAPLGSPRIFREGGLRDTHAFVRTPLKAPAPLSGLAVQDCPPPLGCNPPWRVDLLGDPPPELIGPSPIQLASLPGVLTRSLDGNIAMASGTQLVAMTASFPGNTASEILRTDKILLSPVEAGRRAGDAGGLLGILVSRKYTALNSFAAVLNTGTTIELRTLGEERVAAEALAAGGNEPGPRDNPGYAFTLRKQAIFMVGGAVNGAPTREVWRFGGQDLGWGLVLAAGGDVVQQAAPYDVQSVAFDEQRHRLVFVDFVRRTKWLTTARIVVVDSNTGVAKVALEVPRIGLFSAVYVIARTYGDYVLAGQLGTSGLWTAFEFRVGVDAKLSWRGVTAGRGRILGAPLNTDSGLLLPVAATATQVDMADLSEDTFRAGAGCSSM